MSKKNSEAVTVATVIKWASYVAMFGSLTIIGVEATGGEHGSSEILEACGVVLGCGVGAYLFGLIMELLVNIATDIERAANKK